MKKYFQFLLIRVLSVSMVFVMVFVGAPFVVRAATLNVNSSQDVINGFDGLCTLREAITAANTDSTMGMVNGECVAGSGVDTVSLPAGIYNMSLGGTDDSNGGGDFDLMADVVIQGQGNLPSNTVIDANDIDRVFHVLGTNVVINNLTITDGNALLGGGMMNGGGVLVANNADVNLNIVNFSSNTAEKGGALYVDAMGPMLGTATLSNVVADSNTVPLEGGAFYNKGNLILNSTSVMNNSATVAAGIYSNGAMTLNDSNIANNTAVQNAGGLQLDAFDPALSIVTINRTTIKNNVAGVSGGGIFHTAGALTLKDTTINNNTANTTNTVNNPPVSGGGVANVGGAVAIINSTISGNTITNGVGGAFANVGGSANFVNSTVAFNNAENGGGLYEYNGMPGMTLQNTIVAGNMSSNGQTDDIGGAIVSNGNNLVQNPLGAMGLVPSDITGINPNLAALALNLPGTTMTHALLVGSAAIDAGNDNICADALTVNNLDQRGAVRPSGSHCDIGAYEYVSNRNVDVAVLKTNNVYVVNLGQSTTYVIKVKNMGGIDLNNIQVTDTLPANLTNASWTCAITAGSGSCANAGPVNGSINSTVNLTVGSIATFTLTATVSNTGLKTVKNTATVAVPVGYTDSDLTNNSSTDLDKIRLS